MSEVRTHWDNVPPFYKGFIYATFREDFNRGNHDRWEELFDLAKPFVIIGTNDDGSKYWRIEPEDGKVLTIVIREYL